MNNRVRTSISFERDVFAALEKLRGTNPKFRSQYVNRCIREKLNLPEKGRK